MKKLTEAQAKLLEWYKSYEKEAKERGFDNRADKMGFENYKPKDIQEYMEEYNELLGKTFYTIQDMKLYGTK